MAFNQHKRRSKPGFGDGHGEAHEPVEERRDPNDPRTHSIYTMQYPGYEPQRYVMPKPIPDDRGVEGEVHNNVDRGTHWHGEDEHLAGEPHDKDVASPHLNHSLIDQVYPEHNNEDYCPPVRVEVVGKDPIQTVVMTIGTFHITTQGAANGGQPSQNGLTPVRILGKDPHRRRAVVGLSNVTGGSVPVLLTGEQSSPAYGYPIPAATNEQFELFTTEEAWVSGSLASDDFIVAVMIERVINADPYRGYPMYGDERH
jgi:hypothetical protein